jgi:UPF0042 nucleotide-binding protein
MTIIDPAFLASPISAEVILVTGISGSGKSVAMHALEDIGYFCIDNLPPELLREFLKLERSRLNRRVAVAVDVRSGGALAHLLPLVDELRHEGVFVRSIFLDASSDTLVRRFSESRRPHPLSGQIHQPRRDADEGHVLLDAIEIERGLLAELREASTVIDTSSMRPTLLRIWIRDLVKAQPNRLSLVFESFAFKHGVPLDADYVFDVRILPNPHYIRELRPQTGCDTAVASYLNSQPEVRKMLDQIDEFITQWLPSFEQDQRSYLTVAIGCTGGQHRSVFFAETLKQRFTARAHTLVRHRELDAQVLLHKALQKTDKLET